MDASASVQSDPLDAVLSDPDLLFHIMCKLPDVAFLRPLFGVSKNVRAAALRPDLPLWWSCDEAAFCALEDGETFSAGVVLSYLPKIISSMIMENRPSRRWDCNSVLSLLQAKPRLTALDLSGCKLPSQEAFAEVLQALPGSLTSLSISHHCSQPDAALATMCRNKLNSLSNLAALDLRGILTERSLAGLGLLGRLGRADPGGGSSLAIPLPALQKLSVGFHTFTPFGHRFGTLSSRQPASNRPSFQRLVASFVRVHSAA